MVGPYLSITTSPYIIILKNLYILHICNKYSMFCNGKLGFLNPHIQGAADVHTCTNWQPVTPSTYAMSNYRLLVSHSHGIKNVGRPIQYVYIQISELSLNIPMSFVMQMSSCYTHNFNSKYILHCINYNLSLCI